MKFTSFEKPRHLDDTLDFVKKSLVQNINSESLVMMILERNNHNFIGLIELNHLKTDCPEIGLWIKDEYHNKGIGKKVTLSIINYLKNNYTFYKKVIYQVAKNNTPSIKISKHLGGVLDKNYIIKSKEYTLIRYFINLQN